jgi:hypothetical protein
LQPEGALAELAHLIVVVLQSACFVHWAIRPQNVLTPRGIRKSAATGALAA